MGIIRLILAISVLMAHMASYGHKHAKTLLGFTFVDAITAVQCFFMLSGFYMALVLNEKYVGPGSYSTFLIQRFFRLYPTYWLILTIVAIAELLIAHGGGNRHETTYTMEYWVANHSNLAWPTWVVLVISNLVLFGLNDLYLCFVDNTIGSIGFSISSHTSIASVYTIVPPAWSLGIEVVFYVVAPFIVRRSARWQAALFFTLLAVRLSAIYGLNIPYRPYIFVSAPLQMLFFLAGSLAYQLYRRRNLFHRLYALAGAPWLIFLFFICLFYFRLPYHSLAWLIVYPVMFISIPPLFALTRENLWDRQIGELSYPFYLIHYFIIELANVVRDHVVIPTAFVTPGCILATLLLSLGISKFFESPIDRFRASLFQRRKHAHQYPA